MRTTIFRSSCLVMAIAGALVAPAALSGQRAQPERTHQVRRGDTLWRIAADSLGDGERWREIIALNPPLRTTALVIGTKIRLPATRPGGRSTNPPATPPAIVTQPDTGRAPVVVPRRDTGRTIFYGVRPAGGFTPLESTRAASPPVPAGVFEAVSAPFVAEGSVLDEGGYCVGVGVPGDAPSRGVLLHGSMTVQLPAGTSAPEGSRWLLVRRGPFLTGFGPVGIPTGIIRLTSGGSPGAAGVRAEVVAQFDAMRCGDVILPLPPTPVVPSGPLTAVENGARGQVLWIASESQLPTLQHALIVGIGSAEGVRPGDRVSIYARNGSTVVATANVIRVDQRTATVLVVRQSLGAIAAGLSVRVTEKLP